MSGGKNKAFMAGPVNFMQKYAVCPDNDVQTDIGTNVLNMPTTASAQDYVFNNMPATSQIAWLNFSKRPRGSGANLTFSPASEGAITVDGSFTPTAGKVKSYFLPWTAGGGIIQLAIPAMGPANPNNDVKYFFTATITGCSIFIKGTPQAPVIYHAGGTTDSPNNPNAAARFWRRLMLQHAGAGGITGEVNKTDYVSQQGLGGAGAPATAHSQAFDAWLKNTAPNDLDISWTFPWGCVMGIRDNAGDWAFYLQENVTVYFYRFSKKHWYSKDKTVKSAMTGAARPMLFREFFPNGLAHANFVPSMPRKL